MDMLNTIGYMELSAKYKKYRPMQEIAGNAKKW